MKSYTSSEILRQLRIPFYTLEYWVRTDKVRPIARGRASGREREFTETEYKKARKLAQETRARRVEYGPGT